MSSTASPAPAAALAAPSPQLRPTSDLKNTLLHEMIHAENFLQGIRRDGPDGHGPAVRAAARRR